jgi:hypothetical protein
MIQALMDNLDGLQEEQLVAESGRGFLVDAGSDQVRQLVGILQQTQAFQHKTNRGVRVV